MLRVDDNRNAITAKRRMGNTLKAAAAIMRHYTDGVASTHHDARILVG